MARDGYPNQIGGYDGQNPCRFQFSKPIELYYGASPHRAGYSVAGTREIAFVDGVPPYTMTLDVSMWTYLHMPLPFIPPWNVTDAPASTIYTITGIDLYYWRQAAADELEVCLFKLPLDNSEARTELVKIDKTGELTTTGAWALYQASFTQALTPQTHEYFLRYGLMPNTIADHVKLGPVKVRYQVKGLI